MSWRPRWPWSWWQRTRSYSNGHAATQARLDAERRLHEDRQRAPEIRRAVNAFAAQVEAAMAGRHQP